MPRAEKRETSLELWKKAAAKLDWEVFDNPSDIKAGEGCRDPQPAPPSVAAAFLAAAARTNDDPATESNGLRFRGFGICYNPSLPL